MGKIILFILLFSVSLVSTANELEGVWELVSGEYVDSEGQLVKYNSLDLRSLKILSPTHFSFTSVKEGEFWAAGSGTYKVENGKYTEILSYNSFGQSHGSEFVFDTRVEKDFWYNSRWDGEKRVEYEVWRRVE
ncbi:hypothetical protein [Marinimicrobium agarilyticum]|uniref:hypothetical protein n=1 Tax=Marinimicrobium agarilyticum TaxID=306546 RepID=UPI000685C496|nr:hypothetical protein [Marinimicrobium agarilyticum]